MVVLLLAVLAVVCRCLLIWLGSGDWLAKRVEISTPVNSWTRVQEGIALVSSNYSPYSGDVFHEQALVLTVFQWLTSLGEWAVGAFFISVDVVIAVCLAGIADLHMKDQVRLYYHMDCELHPPLTKLSVEETDQGEEELWKRK
ncbi:Phosphatidylinositol glycan anchor biosynthesis class U protein [Geodia barretti]|uniref:Phosphatidylinositol glycan anchor biosynthesis class U protein n=1 Tax=Geodia barretti TaxID=519541 RepID=A0AA35RTF2_GEOBA|nr:Phosphatidylinositol glycan anchor biosynthesis class U protein [Geodia barretti]